MSRVAEILQEDADLYRAKASDYSPDPEHPFENFESSAAFVSTVTGREVTPLDVALMMVGVKLSRVRTVGLRREATNEPLLDTLRDLRVYLAITEAMLEVRD